MDCVVRKTPGLGVEAAEFVEVWNGAQDSRALAEAQVKEKGLEGAGI